MRQSGNLPNFHFERRLWEKGNLVVAGADEVGRGAFAGPLVGAVVSFPVGIKIEVEIDDSKRLSPRKREEAALWIKKYSLSWGIGKTSVSLINRLGLTKATQIAFRRAINNHKSLSINHLLVDAFYVPYVRGLRRTNQTAIIKGDTKSLSIAAASIIAKVYRDEIMCDIGYKKYYRIYHWEINKGYGTKKHREALIKHGSTKYHRKKFIETFLMKNPQ